VKYHVSWPKEAQDHFEKSIAAHGGWQAYERLASVRLKITEFRGFLVSLKGLGKTFWAPQVVTVDPKNKKAEFDYGTHVDIYQNGELTFSPAHTCIEDGRSIFSKGVFEQWRPEHALYFFGYAWVNYIGYPFILPEFELVGWQKFASGARYEIEFPPSFRTHCRRQTFYFDKNSLLFRHDYHADLAGRIFYGAHFTEDYQMQNGILIACTRKIQPRFGQLPLPGYAIYAKLEVN
jgi:hypothetical protein